MDDKGRNVRARRPRQPVGASTSTDWPKLDDALRESWDVANRPLIVIWRRLAEEILAAEFSGSEAAGSLFRLAFEIPPNTPDGALMHHFGLPNPNTLAQRRREARLKLASYYERNTRQEWRCNWLERENALRFTSKLDAADEFWWPHISAPTTNIIINDTRFFRTTSKPSFVFSLRAPSWNIESRRMKAYEMGHALKGLPNVKREGRLPRHVWGDDGFVATAQVAAADYLSAWLTERQLPEASPVMKRILEDRLTGELARDSAIIIGDSLTSDVLANAHVSRFTFRYESSHGWDFLPIYEPSGDELDWLSRERCDLMKADDGTIGLLMKHPYRMAYVAVTRNLRDSVPITTVVSPSARAILRVIESLTEPTEMKAIRKQVASGATAWPAECDLLFGLNADLSLESRDWGQPRLLLPKPKTSGRE